MSIAGDGSPRCLARAPGLNPSWEVPPETARPTPSWKLKLHMLKKHTSPWSCFLFNIFLTSAVSTILLFSPILVMTWEASASMLQRDNYHTNQNLTVYTKVTSGLRKVETSNSQGPLRTTSPTILSTYNVCWWYHYSCWPHSKTCVDSFLINHYDLQYLSPCNFSNVSSISFSVLSDSSLVMACA